MTDIPVHTMHLQNLILELEEHWLEVWRSAGFGIIIRTVQSIWVAHNHVETHVPPRSISAALPYYGASSKVQ